MRSSLRPSTHRRTSANTRSAGLRSVGRPPLPPPSPWEKPHGPLPRPAPLLNRLAAEPPPLSPTPIAPVAVTSPGLPSLGYPSLYLLLVKLVKHFCWMLPCYLQWPCHTYLHFVEEQRCKFKNTPYRKWYNHSGASCLYQFRAKGF
jgi:hypothetical protein